MTGLDIFAWIVLIVLLATVVFGFVFLAMLPGRIARQRDHPQQDAVNVAGWMGALAGGVLWPLALIWAFYRSPHPAPVQGSALEAKPLNPSVKAQTP